MRAFVFGGIHRSLEGSGDGVPTFGAGVEGEEGVGALRKHGGTGQAGAAVTGSPAFSRPVDDFPIAQIAGSAEGDGAGADAAEGKGYAQEVVGVVGLEDRPARVEIDMHRVHILLMAKVSWTRGGFSVVLPRQGLRVLRLANGRAVNSGSG